MKHGNGFKDLTGQRRGRLLIVRLDPSGKPKKIRWFCLCDCGNECVVARNSLTRGTISCSCFSREQARKRATTHGLTKTREYQIWLKIKDRCFNPRVPAYRLYGGRGITMCDRWKASFLNFLEDIGECKDLSLSVDRINNDGNYEPGNCRWATWDEQANNTRHCRMIEWNNKTQSMARWAKEVGITQDCLHFRLVRRKWSIEKALTTPPMLNQYSMEVCH